ncbi:hypothetical protein Taro_040662 [Colocasia esculenta]|uniref:Uncharacterized protein n=1 Tax=Colocasia esculenta TaxID=4460 RepID=A0A843WJL0_COLES|nr:hypothetical protein [Colocasia esculenta]
MPQLSTSLIQKFIQAARFLLTPLTRKKMVQVNITDWCMSTAIRWLSTTTGHPELDSEIWPLAVDRP